MELHLKHATILISSLVFTLATPASALDLGIGGLEASADLDVNDDSASLDASVGSGGSSLDASVSIGGDTETASADPGDGSGGGTGPGTGGFGGTGISGNPGLNGLTTVSSGQSTIIPSFDFTGLIGSMVMSSDGKAIGYVESARVHETGKILVRVTLLNSLAQRASHAQILLDRKPADNQAIRIGMSLASFLRLL
jgi:hypothetical protein